MELVKEFKMKVVADLYRHQTHLSHKDKGLTFCGARIDNKFAYKGKKYYWIGQVGCKGCRNVLAGLTNNG